MFIIFIAKTSDWILIDCCILIMSEEKQKEAGVISMLASLLIPLYGIIYYVIKRDEVKNASTCLWIAIVSIILECIYGM